MKFLTQTLICLTAIAQIALADFSAQVRNLDSTLKPHTVDILSSIPGTPILIQEVLSVVAVPWFRVKSLGKRGSTLRASINRLVEYNDNVTVSQSTSFVSFRDAKWTNIVANRTKVDNVTTIHKYLTSLVPGTFPKQPALGFAIEMDVTSKATTYQGVQYKADSIKFSIKITGFNYTLTNSKLGVLVGFFSSTRRNQTAAKVGFSDQLSFNWVPTVTVNDNFTAKVVANSNHNLQVTEKNDGDASESFDGVFYGFDAVQPSKVFWDPDVTLEDAALNDDFSNANRTRNGDVPTTGGDAGSSGNGFSYKFSYSMVAFLPLLILFIYYL